MEGSMGMGVMAVFAVSGSVALLAHQLHKRLLSDFMKKIEFEFGYGKCNKKKVHMKGQTKQSMKRKSIGLEGTMPLNRLVLYKGIIQHKMRNPKKEYGVSRGRNLYHLHI
ncbi:hypothetical protein RND81_08G164000 [Saponaria officinalis]|uniref:Uncharacterized protein n=1 Tax=Saponaria officinalis TaxID=3572 RepID=A0AAW1J8Z3_SAPOF